MRASTRRRLAAAAPAQRPGLDVVLREWGRIGCIGFGGPPAHIALLRDLCVERRRWLGDREFEDAIAATNLLPGPASTQLAIYCAWRVGGAAGALVGGLSFIVPGLVADPRPRGAVPRRVAARPGPAAPAPARAPRWRRSPSRPARSWPPRAGARAAEPVALDRLRPRRGAGRRRTSVRGSSLVLLACGALEVTLQRGRSADGGLRRPCTRGRCSRPPARRAAGCSRSPGWPSRSARSPTAAAS